MAHSTDLRERVLDYIEAGHTTKEACQIFRVTRQSIYRWRKLKEETGSVAMKPRTHGAIKLDDQKLLEYVTSHPDLTLKDYAAEFGLTCSGIWRAFKRLKINLKKSKAIYRKR
jgi:putative transposase